MTWQTCKRMMEHCISVKDEVGSKLYEERMKRKMEKQGVVSEPKEKEVKSTKPKEKKDAKK